MELDTRQKQQLEARILINRQQSVLRAIGILKENELLLSNIVNNPLSSTDAIFRNKIWEDVTQAINRFNEAIRDAKKGICSNCNGTRRNWRNEMCYCNEGMG